ncbi:MAG: hypothetical protein CL450_09035 [Acidimicrobiaceae bacterium]|nr:hypothetical protein [Acidimicrobiaceae bacterium]
MQHPVIEEFYRAGTKAEGNRKCFVRLRVPPLQAGQVALEWDVIAQSHSTYKTQGAEQDDGQDAAPCTYGPAVCAALENNPELKQELAVADPAPPKTSNQIAQGVAVFIVRLVQGKHSHVVLVADETGEWGTKSGCTESNTECSVLQYASTENTIVLPSPHLIEIVDQTFPEINRKINVNNDLRASSSLADAQLSDTSEYQCSAELGDRVTHYAYEGAPRQKFGTWEECTENANNYKRSLEEGDEDVGAMDAAIFTCIKNSERPTFYRFKAESTLYDTEAECKQAAANALSARNVQLESDKATASGAGMETFTDAEKKDYGMEPAVTVVLRGSKQIWSHIQTIKSNIYNWDEGWSDTKKVQTLKDNGMPMTPLETSVYLGSSPVESEDRLVDGVRVSFPGDLWLVRDDRVPPKTGMQDFQPTDLTWCVDQPNHTEVLHHGQMPYEIMVNMGTEYPGTCGREHFDYNMGVCRMTREGTFSLLGYDDGVSMPLDCTVETPAQLHAMCQGRIATFDNRSGALRHCEAHGCSGVLHQTDALKSGNLLDKEWAAVTGVMNQDHPFGLKARPGIDSIVVGGIDRAAAGQDTQIPLCGFCDRDGLPAATLPSKEACCRCGGGERRRFFSVPTRLMTNPLVPYLSPRSVQPINGGRGYKVGDVLTLRSDGVPAARGGRVRVTKVHVYEGIETDQGSAGSCEVACNDVATVAIKSLGNNKCLCGKPGDPRYPGAIEEVVIVARGEDYESGAPLYVTDGGSGEGAAFHVNAVQLDGGMLGTEALSAFQSLKNIIAAGLGTVALSAGVAAVFLYKSKGAKLGLSVGGAGAMALLGAIVVLVLGNAKPAPVSERPPTAVKLRAKTAAVCSAGEHLVDGQCMRTEDAKAALMLRHAGFLQRRN